MKVVTGYRMTPVELPSVVGAAAVVRSCVKSVQRSLLRVRLSARHRVAALQPWAERELGRRLVAADARFCLSFVVMAVSACADCLPLLAASLAWLAVEVRSLLMREEGGQL